MKKLVLSLIMVIFGAITLFAQEPKDSDTVWVKEIGSDVKTVRFSPDGNYIYAAALGRKPMKLSTATGEILMEYEGFFYEATEHFSALDISSDGKWLIGGEYGNNMYIIDTETGVILKTLKTNYQDVQSNKFNTVTITPDKRYVIATNRFRSDPITLMNSIIVWDTESGELIKNIESQDFMKVKASPDNRHIAVSRYVTSPIEILIYNTQDWKLEGSLCCHTESIQDIAFSPDGSLLASCGWGNEIKIWNIEKKQIQLEIQSDNYYCKQILFIDNNNYISGGSDFTTGGIEIWKQGELSPSKKYKIGLYDMDFYSEKNLISVASGKSMTLIDISKPLSVPLDIKNSDTTSPNPTNGISQINFILPKSGLTRVSISDMLSNELSILYNGFLEQGEHNFQWIANNVPNGTYFCNIIGQDFSKTLKIMVIK